MKITDIHKPQRTETPIPPTPQPQKEPTLFKSTALLEWNAQEYSFRKKEKSWFISLVIFTTAFLIVAILAKSIMFGILTIVAGFTVGLLAKQKPRVLHFALMPTGIKIHKTVYTYETLKSFWIFYEPDIFLKELSIESKKSLMPYIKIPLGNTDPNKIREILMRFLSEKKHDEPISDTIARVVKF